MGILDLFRKPLAVDDNVFGSLKLITFKDPAKNYFEGEIVFKPTGHTVELVIEASQATPSAAQKKLYTDVLESYQGLTVKMAPLVQKAISRDRITNFGKEFRALTLKIFRTSSGPARWEMSFESTDEEGEQFTVEFKGLEPVTVVAEE